MALTCGDLSGVLAATGVGFEAAPARPVAVQLHAQAAKAWARSGNRAEAAAELGRGRLLLEATPVDANPRNHFAIDHSKWDFYAMDCARRVHDDSLAWSLAETVANASVTVGGVVKAPMRLAEAELTRATVEARAGAVDAAATRAVAALAGGRRSLPSLLMVGRELAREMPASPSRDDFRRHLAGLTAAQ